ncbi:MAG TPA: mechanosensitive ion channel family protein [Steroidobacteraceae bacterium]|nr:mechanosensitive ion channel family protein [Steroidobacteraceae bacterium]
MTLESLRDLGQTVYYGNTIAAWAKAVTLFVLWFTVLPLARAFIARRIRKHVADRPVGFLLLLRSLIDATTRIFMLAVATYLAMRWLDVPPKVDRFVTTAILVALWWQVGHWLSALVRHIVDTRRSRDVSGADGGASLNILRFVGILVAWILAFLMLLTNLGIKIGPLVAGLGIGGIAIALAVQNVLGDLFASLSIALDKPFRVGDALAVGDEKGTVEYIGIKSTRLRSNSGELIVISNSDLLKSRVRNYTRLTERRAELALRIAYETPHELIAELPRIIEAAISAQPKVRFERAHFSRYGDYALLFEATYVVESSDYIEFMDAQQAINLRLLDEFGRRGIMLAYPTMRSLSMTVPTPESPAPQ